MRPETFLCCAIRRGGASFAPPLLPHLRRQSERCAYDSAYDRAYERKTSAAMAFSMHDDRTRRRRRVMHDDRADRSMMHRGMMANGGRSGGHDSLMDMRSGGCPASMAASVRRGKRCAANGSADHSCNHEFLDVLVHITPLSTFFFVVAAGANLPLTPR